MSDTHFQSAKNVFLIANKDSRDLIYSIFKVDTREAVAVFTSRVKARKYIDNAGWQDGQTVAELTPTDFACWVIGLRSEKIDYLTVNPVREQQEDGIAQPVLRIENLVAEFADILLESLETPAPPHKGQWIHYNIFNCQHCANMQRKKVDESTPECCGEPMALSARDTEQQPADV